MKVKICGLKDRHHAAAAAQLGADFLGVVFALSRRQVTADLAKEIFADLPSTVLKVGVFVDEPLDRVKALIKHCGLDAVQLHGEESPEYCQQLPVTVIKAFRVENVSALNKLQAYRQVAEYFLLDTFVQGVNGGSGQTFDWTIARQAGKYGKILLAGGLTPDNVSLAIQTAAPFGVDVSGGVESDGIKDIEKIKNFILEARRA